MFENFMLDRKDNLPIYMNNEAMQNLFTLLINELSISETFTCKTQRIFKVQAPLSELSQIFFGCYVQGNFEAVMSSENMLSETIMQKTINVFILSNLRSLLEQNSLINTISKTSHFENAKLGDYIEFECTLNQNPFIRQGESLMNLLQLMNPESIDEIMKGVNMNKDAFLSYLKNAHSDVTQNHAVRYIGTDICEDCCKAIIPIRRGLMLDTEEYMLSGRAKVFGRVSKVHSKQYDLENISNNPFISHTIFDNINYNLFSGLNNSLFNNIGINNDFFSRGVFNNCTILEVIPLAIYS